MDSTSTQLEGSISDGFGSGSGLGLEDSMADDDDSATLLLIVETRPVAWKLVRAKNPAVDLDAICNQIKVFVNAFLSLHHRNRLICLAEHSDACHFISDGRTHDPLLLLDEDPESARTHFPDEGSTVAQAISALVKSTLQGSARTGAAVGSESPPPPFVDSLHSKRFAQALSMALCYLNRLMKGDEPSYNLLPSAAAAAAAAGEGGGGGDSSTVDFDHGHGHNHDHDHPHHHTERSRYRILSIRASADPPEQYIPIMNCIFAAQRCNIVVDACQIGQRDSSFLQQACHLTGGQYLRPARLGALLQYWLTIFAVDTRTRQVLSNPEAATVDFRASCFCHRQPVDIGYVCSVCLSIFCEEPSSCSTCKAQYSKA